MANTRSINRKPPVPLPDFGKAPPQALDMEEAVLGAVMLEREAVITVLEILKPECFYKDANQKIFKAITDLNKREFPVDLYTVTEELRATGLLESIGGPVYVTQLTSKVVSAANVDYHARIVAQKHIQRELIRASTMIQTRAFDDTEDVTELLDFSENEIFQIAEGNIRREIAPINAVIKDALKEIEEAGKREDALVGTPSGFTKLDRLTSGWQKSELVIIAARPSMGKTAFALSMARNMAIDHGKNVAIFSCEMSSIQLVNRLIVAETDIPGDKIKSGRLSEAEWKQLDSRIKQLVQAPIFIDDTPAISITELRGKCRRLMAQHKLDIVIVDYLQLMSSGPDNNGSREQEVSLISRSLKGIAKELNVPILALSQLNRSVEVRGGTKRPLLSDLRESGAIEQDADMVVFIHRQEKFGIPAFEDGSSTKGIAEIILAKNRNGPVDDVKLKFREEKAQFADLDDFDFDDSPAMNQGFQSVTFGSKMNDDYSRSFGGGFENEKRFPEEAPFA
ncbi:MAG: replicative DNA helicase [Bacteroidales bacterium]|jgi:replicative DNA helicase|nr:replicative DNA helicase [Bacteroidales bacterium]